MKSVAYVTTTFPTLASFVEGEVHRLRAAGVRVEVFTLRGRGTRFQPEHAGLLEITHSVGGPLDPAGWLALFAWLARRPAVLVPSVVRMLWASRASGYALLGHLGYLPAAARIARAVERLGIDRVHGAWAHFPASAAWLAARLTGTRFSMSAHAGADLYRTRAFLREKAQAADFVAACVRGNAEMLRALAPGARIEWIYHGVDLARFDGRGRAPDREPLLLTVGRLAAPKGYDLAIEAVAELAARGVEVRLTLVGDGPERPALEGLARARGVSDRVAFAGELDHDGLLPLYRRAWALLAPSRVMPNGRRDGIPNVVIEAMAMGVPCVGTRAAGLEEAIRAGETGALAEPGDAPSLAAAIEPLVRDPQLRARLGAGARACVEAAFDAGRNFERMRALLLGAPDDAPAALEAAG